MTNDQLNKAREIAAGLTDHAQIITAVVEELHRRETTPAFMRERMHGQGIEYWHELATSAMARNDTLISQLKEKEKIAAEQEQRITSLQNEILNQVYVGTQEDLKAELERVHAAAAEWERKFFATADELDRTGEIAQDARKGQEAVQAELDAVKARYKEDEDIYIRTRESNNRLREQIKSLEQQIDFLQDENQRQAEASSPVAGKPKMRFIFKGLTDTFSISRVEFETLIIHAKKAGASYAIMQERDNEKIFKYL